MRRAPAPSPLALGLSLLLWLTGGAAAWAGEPLQPALARVEQLEQERQSLGRRQQAEEAEAAREASEIESLKGAPPSPTRDLQLQERLARAQGHAAALEQRAQRLRGVDAALASARGILLRACDDALTGTALSTSQRLSIVRLRAAQVDAATAPLGDSAATAIRSAARASGDSDDPRVLRERADLLRDSADKLQREFQRLEERAAELMRRRRLRERAAAVDDDLFAEQVLSRRGSRRETAGASFGDAAASPAPAAEAPGRGGVTTAPPRPETPAVAAAPTPFLSGIDPATLDLLRRGDQSADPEVRLQAIRRAQEDLRRLRGRLDQRAAALERHADELRRQK